MSCLTSRNSYLRTNGLGVSSQQNPFTVELVCKRGAFQKSFSEMTA